MLGSLLAQICILGSQKQNNCDKKGMLYANDMSSATHVCQILNTIVPS
jgi:hypothetical protein